LTPRSTHVVVVPVGQSDRPAGYVELSRGPDFGAEALATARRAFLLAAGGATVLAALVGLLVGRGLTAPLRRLTAAAGQMSSGDLSIRAPVRGRDEIGDLARQFNQMAGRLEASFAALAAERDSLRRFIADASHELRTPVTALKNFNELLQGAAADDTAARAEFLAESQIQLDRLEWITHNLLDLSRLDAGLVALDLDSHDVGDLLKTSVAAFRTLAHEKNVTLSIKEPPSPVQVYCDRARIELVLSNLLDNGLKFTPPGGQVEIGAERAEADGNAVRLWVQDSGPGIPPADRPRIFERFYRGREARGEGSGLGLAIVRSIVQAHRGDVTVESEPGAGSRFAIELPLPAHEGSM
jgi:two-component system sensor histidine kinase BaeS